LVERNEAHDVKDDRKCPEENLILNVKGFEEIQILKDEP